MEKKLCKFGVSRHECFVHDCRGKYDATKCEEVCPFELPYEIPNVWLGRKDVDANMEYGILKGVSVQWKRGRPKGEIEIECQDHIEKGVHKTLPLAWHWGKKSIETLISNLGGSFDFYVVKGKLASYYRGSVN